MNIEHHLAGQQQSFTISVTTGAFSTLRLLLSIIKNALVDLSRMTYAVKQLFLQLVKGFIVAPAKIYWFEQQKMEFKGDA
jgi:hypothetical protein